MERRRRGARSQRTVGAAGALALVATLLSGSVAEAATFTVRNTGDSALPGSDSLRDEINQANAFGAVHGGVTSSIVFASGLSGSIDLTNSLPKITHPVNVYGPGANVLTVRGTGASGVFYVDSGAAYSQISGLTVTGGQTTNGGGIDSFSPLILTGDLIQGNSAVYGGGVYATKGRVLASTISGNNATRLGGGIEFRGPLNMTSSTVTGNTASAGVGGGIWQGFGGMTVTASTISGNLAPSSTLGQGGGIYIAPSSTSAVVQNTIVSGNTAGTGGPDVFTATGAATPTASFSLIGSVAGSAITPDGTDMVDVNPLLKQLALNGASVPTMAPNFNSPVIDRGSSFGLAFDERGVARPVDLPGYPNAPGGDGSDIGAVELQPFEVLPVVTGLSVASGMAGTPVVVSGLRLSTATAVLFGSTPVPFTVNSGGQLVTTAPSGSGTVDVRVTTLGGETPVNTADQFTFTVPTPSPAPGPGPSPGPPPPAPQLTKASSGDQAITLTTPPLSACTSSTSRLSATLTSSAVPGSRATRLRFSSAGFFLDRGIKHTRKKIEHLKHGKTKRIRVTTYRPNLAVHHVPETIALKLAGLEPGSHTLKVVLSYKKTVTRHHHQTTITVTKTITSTFKVC